MFLKKFFKFTNLFWIGILLSLLLSIGTRFIGLTHFPPSLYWEEAALGYDAYSILKTGHDFHGHLLPLVAFESFGDYKPSFYFYALVPSIAAFGLTDFAVRFPSALSGVFLVIGIGLMANEFGYSILKRKSFSTHFPKILQVMAMLITSISPWAIEFSRGGWEVNVATTLLVWGMWLQLRLRRQFLAQAEISIQKPFFIQYILPQFFSLILLALSMYTYHSTRIVSPVLLLVFWIMCVIEIWNRHRKSFTNIHFRKKFGFLLVAGLVFTLLISPIIISLKSPQTQQRFAETSLFADGRQVKISNQLIANSQPHWLGKTIYHRYVISAELLLQNYLTHFSFKFLFLTGDNNPRHSVQFVGLMYSGEVLFLLAGLYFFISRRNTLTFFVLFWLLLGIVPAAATTATPHALRILPSLPAWMILLTAGAFQIKVWVTEMLGKIFKIIPFRISRMGIFTLVVLIFTIFYGWQFISYWRFYSLVYPKLYVTEWQYGYQQMVTSVAKAQTLYPLLPVEISREYGRPSTYYWFYTKTDPLLVQAEEKTAKKDQGEFLQFKNISFANQITVKQKTIVASSEITYQGQVASHHVELFDTVNDPLGHIVWRVYLEE